MAQIFASDRAARARAAQPAARGQTRRTAPEQALAAVQSRADASGPTARLARLQALQTAPLQRMEEEEPLQGRALQRMDEEEPLQGAGLEEEDLMQGKARSGTLQQQEAAAAGSGGAGGLPGGLRQGVEALSGADLSGVRVHYGSSAPAQVGAHAFAQGSDIHVARGQERHLPHEAWHVAQQKQGRVAATTDVAGTPVNDDPALEREADVMGAKASQLAAQNRQG